LILPHGTTHLKPCLETLPKVRLFTYLKNLVLKKVVRLLG